MATKVELIITGDSDDAIRAIETLRRAEQQHAAGLADVDKAQTRVGSSAISVASAYGAVAGAMAGMGIATLVSDLIRVNSEFDRLHAGLVTITGSLPNANAAFDQLEDFATRTPYQLSEVVTAFSKLSALNLDASTATLESYGNTASAMGKSLNDMIEAVADASTGEFERLKEFGIKAKSEGDKVTFTFRGVSTTVEKEASAIQQYLLKIGQTDFAGGMVRQMDTIGGATSNFADQYDKMLRKVGEELPIQGSVETATEALKLLTEHIDAVVIGFGTMATAATAQLIVANIGAITAAVRTLAASTAVATGGLSLLAGAAAVALYEVGGEVIARINETDEAASSASGTMEMLAAHTNTAANSTTVIAKAQEDAAKAAKEHEKAVKAGEEALGRYSAALKDLGQEQLRQAETGFSRDMERQAEYFARTATAASNLTAPIQSYLAVIDQVYGAQKKGQEDILATLVQIGASDAARLQQQINLGTVEKTMLEGRRKAWETYASDVEKLVGTAWDNLAKKEEALLQSRLATQGMLDDLNAKANPKQEKDQFTSYLEDKDSAQALERRAAAATTLAEKIRLMTEAQQAYAKLGRGVEIDGTIIVDKEIAAGEAAAKVKDLGTALDALHKQQVDQAAEQVQNLTMIKGEAEAAIKTLNAQLIDLDTKLATMALKTITVEAKDQATSEINTIQQALEKLKDKTVTVTTRYVNNIPGGGSQGQSQGNGGDGGGSSESGGDAGGGDGGGDGGGGSGSDASSSQSLAAGPVPRSREFIPKTKTPATSGSGQPKPAGAASQVIQFTGPISFAFPNVTNATDARDLVPEIVRLLRERYRIAVTG